MKSLRIEQNNNQSNIAEIRISIYSSIFSSIHDQKLFDLVSTDFFGMSIALRQSQD
jgi:hypothetical protein